MDSGIESLNKIVKDGTRRKIVLTLRERGMLSYTELMETLLISSTGTLNYHLKVLDDLLEKTDSGQYMLSEKGKRASRFLTELPEQDNSLKTKKVWWRRFWSVAILFPTLWLIISLFLRLLGYIDSYMLVRTTFGFISVMTFTYFFYRIIRPKIKEQKLKEQTMATQTVFVSERNEDSTYSPTDSQNRTVKDIFVSGRQLEEVKKIVQSWVREERIRIEVENDYFIRGRLGIPSGLGLTAPKYFEISFKPNQNGVIVHTEGWISVYDISEKSFSNKILVIGSIPRMKGWKVMEHLWQNLKMFSKS